MIKKISLLFLIFFFSVSLSAQINELNTASSKLDSLLKKKSGEEFFHATNFMISITKKSFLKASINGGFYNNSLIKIIFPKELTKTKLTLIKLGLENKLLRFEKQMNKVADQSCEESANIFIQSISAIKFDKISITNIDQNSSLTDYLINKKSKELYISLYPLIEKKIFESKLLEEYNFLINKYNKIPFTKKINFDIKDYIVSKTLLGINTVLISEEENKIKKSLF